jgi:hypothetical protein
MHDNSPDWLLIVREKVETLRYGVVQIVIHDSKVTQIDRTERTRIESRSADELSRPAINRSSDRPDILEETISH